MPDRLRDFSMTDRSPDMKREFAGAPDTVLCACVKGAACDSRKHAVGWRVCDREWPFDALKEEQEQPHKHPALRLAGYSVDTVVAGVLRLEALKAKLEACISEGLLAETERGPSARVSGRPIFIAAGIP